MKAVQAMTRDDVIGSSWQKMTDALGAARQCALNQRNALTPRDQSEGARFLTRLTAAAFDMFIEYGDPARPEFVRLMGRHRKFFGDNPDADYDFAAIDAEYSYLVAGVRGTSEYLACCVYGSDDSGRNRIVANVSDRDLTVGSDGRFALYLSTTPPPAHLRHANWIQLAPDATTVIFRQYYLRRESEQPARFDIVRVDQHVAGLSSGAQRLGGSLQAAAEFIYTATMFTVAAASAIAAAPNELTVDSNATSVNAFYPTPDNRYMAGWFRLRPGEALVMDGFAPGARYWSVLLMNRWMESLDSTMSRTSLNNADIVLAPDGGFRVVIAAADPQVPNWLTTDDHDEGYVMLRWMQAEPPRTPQLSVMPIDEVAASSRRARA